MQSAMPVMCQNDTVSPLKPTGKGINGRRIPLNESLFRESAGEQSVLSLLFSDESLKIARGNVFKLSIPKRKTNGY